MKINKLTESKKIKEGYSHFEFTSGANPYIAKTKDEAERIKRSRGDSAKYVGSINGIDYYKVDDSEKDLFRVDESYGSEKHPEQDMITDALMNIKGTTKVEFDYRPNDGVYRNPENHLILLVFCKDADIFGDGFDYFRNRKEWKNKVISTLRSLGWVQEDPMEDNDTYLYLVLKKRAVTEDLDNQEVIFQKGNKKIIKDGYGYAIDDGINANRFYVNDNGEPKFDDGCSSKYWLAKVKSLIKSGEITPRKNESLNEGHQIQNYKGYELDWNEDGIDPEEGVANFEVYIRKNGKELTDKNGSVLTFNGFRQAREYIDNLPISSEEMKEKNINSLVKLRDGINKYFDSQEDLKDNYEANLYYQNNVAEFSITYWDGPTRETNMLLVVYHLDTDEWELSFKEWSDEEEDLVEYSDSGKGYNDLIDTIDKYSLSVFVVFGFDVSALKEDTDMDRYSKSHAPKLEESTVKHNINEDIEVSNIAHYIIDHYEFDDMQDKHDCINSIRDSFKYEKTISKEELEQFIGAHNGRDKMEEDFGFKNGDRYLGGLPSEPSELEYAKALNQTYLNSDKFKEEKQFVIDFAEACKLDGSRCMDYNEFAEVLADDGMIATNTLWKIYQDTLDGRDKVNESKSIKESSYKKGDRVELDNGMTGTVTKDFDWENEDQVSVEIDGTKEMRYPRSETLKDLRESYQDYRFDVSCNDGPTKTVSLVWKENDIEGAKEMAKKYYAQEHTTYADDRENKWTIEESLTEDTAVSSSMEFDDDTDDMSFYYEDEQWEEPGVSPRKDFYEDGKEFTWVKRHGDVEHLDFDNWSVWEAYCHDDAESYYFIVDEDTEFIDWGPVDTLEEAQEFLQSKVSDWENDYEFVDNFVDDDLDEGIFDKIKGYGKDLVKGIASQAGTIAKNAAGMAKQAVDNKRGNDLQNSVGGDIFTLAKGAGAEVTTTSDNKSTIIQLPDNMNANDKKALLDAINETGIKYDKNLAAKGMIQIPTSEVKKAQKVINKDKKMQLKADNKQAKAQQDLKNMFSQAGITKLSQLKDLGILSESFGDENAYDVSVYLFPPLTDEDLDMLRAYNLTYLGRNYGPYGDEDNYVVAGNESSLRNYANKYLGYELHPGYLYDYDDFAGEIEVNENLLSEGLQEEPHSIEAGPTVGMAQLLSDLIKDEYEAIDGYNSVIATADAEGYDDMIDVLTDVQAEENVHIGQLQELRKMVDPNAHMVEDGEEEAEEELSNPIM